MHGIAVGISPLVDELFEGALIPGAGVAKLGKNSYLRAGWLPPDPPPGHGVHQYVFSCSPSITSRTSVSTPGDTLVKALRGHVLAQGSIVGTYAR